MAQLDAGRHPVLAVHGGDSRQAVDLAIVPQARAAMGDATVAGHRRGLHERRTDPAEREPGMMPVVPVLHLPLDRLILAHRRDDDPIAQFELAQADGREQLGRQRLLRRLQSVVIELRHQDIQLAHDCSELGHALLAFPADYGESGVMSFMVGEAGIVYEADLGDDTLSVAAAIDSFDPGDGWTQVEETEDE
jgi:hypothetical protein